ncbi:MAG: hypothetical protein LCH76_10145 [Actinobacteria bacterium]|nr:hypothetical protein [Actinomycetota bacterium]
MSLAYSPAFASPLAVGVAQALPRRPRQITDAHHAGRVLAAAPTNRCVLPRWGIDSPIRDHGAEPGQHTGTVSWTSREHYLRVIVPAAIAQHTDILAKHGISADTFTRWATAKSLYAQERCSGRRVIVRPVTLAGLLQCAKRTVQRCQAAAREIGLEVVITPGRMLSEIESYKARKLGSPQRGLSTVTAFVVPASLGPTGDKVTPTSGESLSASVTDLITFHDRSARPKGAPLRSAPPSRRSPPGRKRPRNRSGPAWDLAVELVQQVIFLSQCPAGRIVGQLQRFTAAGLPRWTAERVTRAMDAVNRRHGYTAPTKPKKAPWGLLAWYLRQIDPIADNPGLDRPLVGA